MNCQRIEQLLSEQLEGRGSQREIGPMEAHLSECPACRRMQEELQALRSGLRALAQQEPLPDSDSDRRAIDRWLAEREASRGSWSRWLWPTFTAPAVRWLALGGAAAALLLALAVGALRVRTRTTEPQQPLVVVKSPRPDQGGDAPKIPTVAITGPQTGPTTIRLSPQPPAGGLRPGRHSRPKRGFVITPPRNGIHPARHTRPSLTPSARKGGAPNKQNGLQPSHSRAMPAVGDDLAYVNPDAGAVIRQWAPVPRDEWSRIEARIRRTVRVRDDFVQVPFPRIAAASERQIAAAAALYRKEAAVVDPRLSREVTLRLKATSFSDLCDRLRAEAGIAFTAGPKVGDDKVTIFCEKQPLREIMRRINQVFGFTWLRSGEAGAYRYELTQDLRAQLAEEELRNRDLHTALIALDEAMAAFKPDLDLSRDELEHRLQEAEGPEKQRLLALQSGAAWAAVQLYQRLTGAQRLALMGGETVEFKSDAEQPDQRLPEGWQKRLASSGPRVVGLEPAGTAAGTTTVGLRIDRSELGQLSLKYQLAIPSSGGSVWMELQEALAVGQSPSVAKPDNAAANRSLRADPQFQRRVSLKPRPSCPRFAASTRPPVAEGQPPLNSHGEPGPEPVHVSAADVWEAVHQKTGLPVIADAYSRAYPVDGVTVEPMALFGALNRVAEALGVTWRKEGDFLLCRSTSYFWDRLKEVPNRYLACWQQDSRANGGLPFEDFVELAALSDPQLDSALVGQVIEHCWGLEEWAIIGSGSGPGHLGAVRSSQLRPFARCVAMLTPEQRRQALQSEWLAVDALTPAQQAALARALQPITILPQFLAGTRIRYAYVPAGWYVSGPWPNSPRDEQALKQPVVAARTREAALAEARRLQPGAGPEDIRLSHGIFALMFRLPEGLIREIGWPMTVN